MDNVHKSLTGVTKYFTLQLHWICWMILYFKYQNNCALFVMLSAHDIIINSWDKPTHVSYSSPFNITCIYIYHSQFSPESFFSEADGETFSSGGTERMLFPFLSSSNCIMKVNKKVISFFFKPHCWKRIIQQAYKEDNLLLITQCFHYLTI